MELAMDWGYEDVIFETDAQIVKIDAQVLPFMKMSQREGIVEDVNDESSAHHEAPPPLQGRGRGRSSGSNTGRGRPRGRGRTSRGGRAIEHLINYELVGNPMPQQIPMPQPNPMPQQNLASTQDVVLTGLQGVTRAVEALTSIIVDHVARTNTPAREASRQVQEGHQGHKFLLFPKFLKKEEQL
ncbi:uncharacterized protein G2W53_041451 [Senna tora]|uniref:Uncharacterized protein n=1 Tax=Senna tora TaxID=362788 RepID=A0A834VZ69_9FABA|nr:uncharacterized protein G2W53_041451 [Senna tora]